MFHVLIHYFSLVSRYISYLFYSVLSFIYKKRNKKPKNKKFYPLLSTPVLFSINFSDIGGEVFIGGLPLSDPNTRLMIGYCPQTDPVRAHQYSLFHTFFIIVIFFLIPSFLISAFISFCTVWPILSHDFHFLACYNFIFFHFFSPLIWKLNSFFLLIFKIFQRLLFVLKLHMITTLIIIFFHFNWFIIFNSLTIIKFIWWKLYCFLFIS